MTREEAKAYFAELAQKSGLAADKATAIMQVLDDEAAAKAFLDGFIPRPEFSKGLDAERTKAQTEIARWSKWYNDEAKPAYDSVQTAKARLKAYEDRYGDIAAAADPEGAAAATGLSMAQVEKLLNDRLKERDSAYVNFTKSAVRVAQDYQNRFHKPLDVDALEKFALEKALPLDSAYDQYIAPEAKAQSDAEWEAKLKAAREEGARDALSKARNPLDASPRDADHPHPLFDRKAEAADLTDQQRERVSYEAFMSGLHEAPVQKQ